MARGTVGQRQVLGAVRPRRNAFRRGLTAPSLLVLLTGLALLVIALMALNEAVVSGAYTVLPEGLLLRQTHDDWLHVSYTVGRLKRHPPQQPAVYLIGGSSTRECFVSEGTLADQIRTAGGSDVEVHALASNNEHFGTDLAIVDNLPRTPGVVVICIGVERFVYGPERTERQIGGRPLLIWSAALKDYVSDRFGRHRWAASIVPGLIDYGLTWADWRAFRALRGRPAIVAFEDHFYTQADVESDAHKRRFVERWLTHRGRPGGEFDRVFDYNADLLEQTVALARQRGFEVVLLENPLNTEIVGHDFDRLLAQYRPLCAELARRYGARYVDPNLQTDLHSSDFRDLTHLVPSGRVKFQRAMADVLAPSTSGLQPARPAP
jgi:hypothetical protein